MPKLGQYQPVLDIVFFLYRSVEDARRGKNSGGTGFLVAVPTPWSDRVHVYGVTNWHVAVDQGASVVRFNTKDGHTDIFEFGPEDWQFIPNYHDIAIIPLSMKGHHKVKYLDNQFLASEDYVREQEIGPGDDVFMVGRFIDFDGAQTNRPSLRFGHISMADAPITQPNGYKGESLVVDMHSRTGFSGSPVFVYRTVGSHFLEGKKGSILVGGGHMMSLLGIHWGQFPELWELKEKFREDISAEGSMVVDGAYVEGLSGMTCVCPSHAIRKVLDMPKEQERRQATEQVMERALGSPDLIPRAEIASEPPTTDENPRHKEDFNSLLDAAVKGPQSDDQT